MTEESKEISEYDPDAVRDLAKNTGTFILREICRELCGLTHKEAMLSPKTELIEVVVKAADRAGSDILSEFLDQAQETELAEPLPQPGVEVTQFVEQRRNFTDKDLSPVELWVEMGRIAEVIGHYNKEGNMVGIDHASMEMAELYRLLDKRRRSEAGRLSFVPPSQAFEDGMMDVLGMNDTQQLGEELSELEEEDLDPEERLERMENHIKALEASLPSMIQTAVEKAVEDELEMDRELEDIDLDIEPDEKEIAESIARNTAEDFDESLVQEVRERLRINVAGDCADWDAFWALTERMSFAPGEAYTMKSWDLTFVFDGEYWTIRKGVIKEE